MRWQKGWHVPSLGKMGLYARTTRYLRPRQVACRLARRAGLPTPLSPGFEARLDPARADVARAPALPELDFDPVFLSRFDVEALMRDEVKLLHHVERVDWERCWHAPLATPLWRYNLHYMEYLLPLAHARRLTGEAQYAEKAKRLVDTWIDANPRGLGGAGWDPYPIAMRAANWLALRAELRGELEADEAFLKKMDSSLAEQAEHLSQHAERDLLANHYLEDLKACVLLAAYFDDEAMISTALPLLEEQVAEQVLPDGMHFERSPMYHKIVLEGLLRVAAALRESPSGVPVWLSDAIRHMCGCLHSLERGVSRTPLFNDAGDNVAKGRDALLECARRMLGIEPRYRDAFPDAGYYLMEGECAGRCVKVIFDVGTPGPAYALGHAHCDALSMEVFVDGEPWIVNGGTYAYQDVLRGHFRSTEAHSTVQVGDAEQHECWGEHRVARRGSARLVGRGERWLEGEAVDFRANRVRRRVELVEGGLRVRDRAVARARDSEDVPLVARFLMVGPYAEACCEDGRACVYAPEFGVLREARLVVRRGEDTVDSLLLLEGDGNGRVVQ